MLLMQGRATVVTAGFTGHFLRQIGYWLEVYDQGSGGGQLNTRNNLYTDSSASV